ncbi:hypothetical protein Pla100_24490 [Neorhodopirellula pilleata]|uniref:Uncharacterized protein n=1 Tax=Neorhodopirellula pilleata TaxID=2714738 RepID=A0A5C6AD07_9BACT|nr:hypothetical protein Pla100_24490 [Neorhodopirellula pilleata]
MVKDWIVHQSCFSITSMSTVSLSTSTSTMEHFVSELGNYPRLVQREGREKRLSPVA